MLKMSLLPIRNVLGAASCKLLDTEAIASVLHSDDRHQTELLRVEWHEGEHRNSCLYHSNIIQRIFNKYCNDSYDRKFIIRLWISPGQKTLECAINASMLAILDTGISINDVFVAIQEKFELFVFNRENKSVFYLKDILEQPKDCPTGVSETPIQKIEEKRSKILFEIENKYQFKL